MKLKKKIILILVCTFFYFFIIDFESKNNLDISDVIQAKIPGYFVGEKYKIVTNKFLKYKGEKIKLKVANSKKAEISGDYLMMKSKGKAYLNVYTKYKNYTFCFNIYKKSDKTTIKAITLTMNFNSTKKIDIDEIKNSKINLSYKSNHPEIIQVNNKGILKSKLPGKSIITISGLKNRIMKIKVLSVPVNGTISNNTLKKSHAEQFKNVMIVAHPDDETLWGGANLYKDKYFVVCLTNGHNLYRVKDFRKILTFTKNKGIILDYPDIQGHIIDKWKEFKEGIIKDLKTIISYNNWNKIVTHGPEGTTGHIHHKKISSYITMIAKKKNLLSKLYYFGKVYKKGKIPKNLHRINKTELRYKLKEVSFYKSKAREIHKHWYHMIPYENWKSVSKIKRAKKG